MNTIELCGLGHHRYRTSISVESFKSEIRFLTCQKLIFLNIYSHTAIKIIKGHLKDLVVVSDSILSR